MVYAPMLTEIFEEKTCVSYLQYNEEYKHCVKDNDWGYAIFGNDPKTLSAESMIADLSDYQKDKEREKKDIK
jgi:hypothetical protein